MFDCDKLIHPFQNEPGTSQRQRVMDDLLSGSAKVDGRSMADLLDYFVQLSRHINYYDDKLNVSDWQPFFRKSIPFSLAAIIKFKRDGVSERIDAYTKLFEKKPSKAGLQLLFHYFFHQVISQVNNWHLQLKGSGLPAELIIEKLIRDKLKGPLEKFICYHNAAVKWYCVKALSFSRLAENPAWNIDLESLAGKADNCKPEGKSKRKRLAKFHQQVRDLIPSFLDSIRIISDTSEQSMEQSLFPLKEELQKKHTPHLALLFAFLKLFQHLQGDLNSYTKKHLDYFYKQVLKLKPRDAVSDKVHLVFEIQKQLDKYLLKKGLRVKDGKDNNKAEILFATDDEIVVNKTQVADKRTLFLNYRDVLESSYLEGVYMASNADKADGLKIDFRDADPKSFATLGTRLSKYRDPEKTLLQPYPNARLGFILASPVLLLNEGKRTIDITIACRLMEDYCNEMGIVNERLPGNCCEDENPIVISGTGQKYPDFIGATFFYNRIRDKLNETYYYISEDLIVEASKKGISKDLEKKLRDFLVVIETKADTDTVCYCPVETHLYDKVLTGPDGWDAFFNPLTGPEKDIIKEIFKPRKALSLLFSGEKEWMAPQFPYTISIIPAVTSNEFRIKFNVTIGPEQPAITYYDKEKLKEDFNTTQPLVKVELDDKIKLVYSNAQLTPGPGKSDKCCLLRTFPDEEHAVSLYHFFRNVKVVEGPANDKTRIDVSVCGLKKFIVQNEEGVQDVNGPVYPFGSRPDVIDFDVNHTISNTTSVPGFPNPVPVPVPNLVGPNFYIGSKEIFLKKWEKVCVNINWKDKPVNFNDFYTAYIKREIPDPLVPGATITILGLNESDFQVNFSLLEDGKWKPEVNTSGKCFENTITNSFNRRLFIKEICGNGCVQPNAFQYSFYLEWDDFPDTRKFIELDNGATKFEAGTLNGFIRINLQNQDFLHKDYAYVLARQMMAMGKFPEKGVEGAIYLGAGNAVIVFKDTGTLILAIRQEIANAVLNAALTKGEAQAILNNLVTVRGAMSPGGASITNAEFFANLNAPVNNTFNAADDTKNIVDSISAKVNLLQVLLSIFKPDGTLKDDLSVPIPNEPWTPIIKNISLDYTATASITDIDLIHLYPYEGTYKKEELGLQPTLFPTFCDEGTLFVGLKDLVPGSNVNMLFQLAEATADSESDREEPVWHYLDNNQWKTLRKGFEVLDDDTDGLTTSGIIKFALPANMTKENTILPKELHWIKASVPKSSRTVSEIIGIYTQAIRATFTNEVANDKIRLSKPLAAGAIAKLNESDANVKKLNQPFDSFGGRQPEAEGHFYVRVSELLRHKGRAIQKFDYERLALEAFPQLYKVKCINHSFALNAYKHKNDFPIAPGFVVLAVIPDFNQLKASQSFEPRVPVSMLEDIQDSMKKLTSPFVRFRAMNPRYEKVNFCLSVKLIQGKDENYYKEKMKLDLREFMAPWAVGKFDKLAFGQCVTRSEIIGFLESRDYMDYIIQLIMWHENDLITDKTKQGNLINPVCPKTPRSILIAGNIDICIASQDCEKWQECGGQKEIECCDSKKIPIVDYCVRDIK